MKYLKKDWPLIFILIFSITGGIWCFFDLFSNLENFAWGLQELSGVVLMIIGKSIEVWVRKELQEKAKYFDWISTMKLRINQGHLLITSGLFKFVRHPLYTGTLLQGLGWGLLSSSIYGTLLMFIGLSFLIPRIKLEEEMLFDKFNDNYIEYKKHTKKLIPFIY